MTRFNKDALLIDEADDKALVIAFTSELQSLEFLFSIYKNDPKKMADMLYKATKYINAEEAMIARGDKLKKRERQKDHRQDRGRKLAWMNDRRDDRDNATLTWPNKLKGDPNKRPKNKYCHFHRDHEHDTSECYDLKQQKEAFIN